jgi:predicted aldo/keto reductase-like oxidoreductase
MTELPKRALGGTGLDVSILGLGGYHVGAVATYAEAADIVSEAVDLGINFFDNGWEYNDGRSEEWMGRALAGRRDKVVLMSKVCTHGDGRDVAMRQLEDTLRRLRTDCLDVWQIHDVLFEPEPALHFAAGGVVEAMEEAKKQGKVRFVGFSAHKHPERVVQMLSYGYHFDVCQFPLNCFDATHSSSFERTALPVARERGVGVIGMKSLGGRAWFLEDGNIEAGEALRYAMSLPVATTVSGIDSLRVLRENVASARDFLPMTVSEMEELRQRAAPAAADARHERYKQDYVIPLELPRNMFLKIEELLDALRLRHPGIDIDHKTVARALVRSALDQIVLRDPNA